MMIINDELTLSMQCNNSKLKPTITCYKCGYISVKVTACSGDKVQ